MAEFLVEVYRAHAASHTAAEQTQRARDAAAQLSREGTPVRYLSSIFLPDDETCFYLYDAASADAVRKVALRAELPFARIVKAITDQHEQPSATPNRSWGRPVERGTADRPDH